MNLFLRKIRKNSGTEKNQAGLLGSEKRESMKSSIKQLTIVLSFLLLVLTSFLYPSTSYALFENQSAISNDNASCYSLDVVFLMDQSGSMKENDPDDPKKGYGLRNSSVDWVIDWLGDNILSYCPDAIHRIAVVSWGDGTSIGLNEVVRPRSIEEWRISRDDLKTKVEITNRTDTYQNTLPDVAFRDAQDILKDFSSVPLGGLPRKRVIIFVTDGLPAHSSIDSVKDYSNSLVTNVRQWYPFDSVLLQRDACLAGALDKARTAGRNDISPEDKNDCLADFKVDDSAYVNSTYIWSILLNAYSGVSPDRYSSFYNAMDQISRDHAGKVVPIDRNTEIPGAFLDIMTTMAGVRAERLGCQPFAMDPYLQQATLSFFKIDEDISVEISYESGGQTYTITQDDLENKTMPLETEGFTVKDYTSDNAIERYVFLRPHAGFWNIRVPSTSNCDGIQAFFEPLDFDVYQKSPPATVPQYDLPPFYDTTSPVYIEYQLVNREAPAEMIGPDPQYPLTMTAKLKKISSGEELSPIDLQYDPVRGTYRSKDPLLVGVVEKYELTVRAETSYVDTEIQGKRVLFEETHFFEIIPVTPFRIVITEPQAPKTQDEPLAVYPLHGGVTTGLKIVPVEFRVILTDRTGNKIDPSLVFSNPNVSLQGTVAPTGEKVTFTLDPNHPDEFLGSITSLRDEGTYHLSVFVEDETAYIDLYRPDNKIVGTDFILRDTLFTRPITYKVLGIAALLAAIIAIVLVALNRNNPVTGTLVFEIGTTHIADIPIGTGWNVSKISRGTLQAYSSLGLRSLKAYKSKEQLGCIDYQAVDMNGASYNGTLMPESATPFTGGMTVRYEPLESQ